MRRVFVFFLAILFVPAAAVFAGAEARMSGKVIDAVTKEPIPDAVITVEATEVKQFKQDFKLKKDGSFAIFLLDGTIKYKFTCSAPGYVATEDVIKLKLGETNMRDFELRKVGAGGLPAGEEGKPDPAVEAYNAGAKLANSGDYPGAIAKFEEAVTLNADLFAGWTALARTAVNAKDYPKAINAAKKVLDVDDSDADMWAVLYTAYTATGDKANAAIAEKKMPATAPALFNQGARLINEGKDEEAEKVLERAISLDDKFKEAYYELGMVYVRGGKNDQAKEALTKYIELAGPEVASETEIVTKCKTQGDETNCVTQLRKLGNDVATAKEMLKYLK